MVEDKCVNYIYELSVIGHKIGMFQINVFTNHPLYNM